ncbi:MAG TPA: CocE/NonD family hydrolase [Solirubrobacteraceae bacterium]|jgi:predicted acyl esterase
MRGTRTVYALALLVCLLAVAPAQAAVTTTPVSIPASQPDDQGDPVVLDGGVTYPSEGCPCPGVIINHGFLGRWQDSGRITEQLAAEGYVVLRYSSRGFGETPGEVDLMGPKETQDLLDAVDWLNDPSSPVVGGKVIKDRIGQFGGSYGGAHAWALAASGHPAVRTTIPTATWTDIYDALLPNGVMLLAYANGFYASGYGPTAGLLGGEASADQNYSQNLHRWMAEVNSGVGVEDAKAGMATRSVATDYGRVKVPVFIVQGLNDGLFSVNQAIEAYQAIRGNGVPARLYLGGIGHPPSDGSLDSPEARHVGDQVLAWFDRYLKGERNGIDKRAPIEYSEADYFHNRWDGTTRTARSFPFGKAQTAHLCTTGPSGGTLSPVACPAAPPAVATNGNAGTGYDQEPVTSEYAEELQDGFAEYLGTEIPDLETAPTILNYDTAPLPAALPLAGIPKLRLRVAAADVLPAGVEPATAAAFQLDPKLYDVAPDGTTKLLTRGAFAEPLDAVAPGTSTVPAHPVTFDAFGFSNTIPAGHRLRLALQTSDAPYLRPTPNPFAAAILAGSTVDLPAIGAERPMGSLPIAG